MRTTSHVLYGGAHLFSAKAPEKLAKIARDTFAKHGKNLMKLRDVAKLIDPFRNEILAERVQTKLATKAIEAMCIDFEDGFGPRTEDEEDEQAKRCARELRMLDGAGPRIGIRIRSLSGRTRDRAQRTLKIFLGELDGKIPPGFSVTLPKIESAAEVAELAELAPGIDLELMIETPHSVMHVPQLLDAARGRCKAIHLGAYDLTASIDVIAVDQALDHPLCEHALLQMKVATAGTGVAVVDGATALLPWGDTSSVHEAWRVHAANVRRALRLGVHEGWDLHPSQLPGRWLGLFAVYIDWKDAMQERLRRFREAEERATRMGMVFDDAATGRGLHAFFERGVACGALLPEDVPR